MSTSLCCRAYGIAITNSTVETDTMTCEHAKDGRCGMRKKGTHEAFWIPRHIVTINTKGNAEERSRQDAVTEPSTPCNNIHKSFPVHDSPP